MGLETTVPRSLKYIAYYIALFSLNYHVQYYPSGFSYLIDWILV